MSRLAGAAKIVKGAATQIRSARAAITLTPNAVQRVRGLMQQQPDMTAIKVQYLYINSKIYSK